MFQVASFHIKIEEKTRTNPEKMLHFYERFVPCCYNIMTLETSFDQRILANSHLKKRLRFHNTPQIILKN